MQRLSSWAADHYLLWLPSSHLIMVLCPISLSVITARPPWFTEDIPLLASSVSNPGIFSQVVSSQIESNSNTTELGVLYSFSQLRSHKKTHPLMLELRSYCCLITTTKTTIISKSRAPQGAPAQDQLAVEHLGRRAQWRRRPTHRGTYPRPSRILPTFCCSRSALLPFFHLLLD